MQLHNHAKQLFCSKPKLTPPSRGERITGGIANGDEVKFAGQFYVFDVSRPEVRKWWLDTSQCDHLCQRRL